MRRRHNIRRGAHWSVLCSLALGLGACSSAPPEPTALGERARLLREFEQHHLTGVAAADGQDLMMTWQLNGDIREAYARMLFEAGDLEGAAHQLHLGFNSPEITRRGTAWALYLKARLAMARREWVTAAGICTDVLTVQPKARWNVMRLARGLQARAQRLQPLAEWPTYASNHFVFHHAEASVRAQDMAVHVRDLAVTRDAEFERLAEVLGVEITEPIHVYLHEAGAEIAQIFGGPDARADAHALTIHEAPEHDDTTPLVARILTSRIGDVFIQAPLVEDGLVAYLTSGNADAAADAPPLPELLATYSALPAEIRVRTARAFVAGLIDEHGMEQFREFWALLAFKPVAEALEEVYGNPGRTQGSAPTPTG